MKAARLHGRNGTKALIFEEAPLPEPTEGEVRVRVHAVGVTPGELNWPETWKTSTGEDRNLSIPGHEFSGIVDAVGRDITSVTPGTTVYAFTDFTRDGAEAEYAIALPSEIARKPKLINHIQAATLPLSGLTAWQALFVHAKLSRGQSILIHGAAGGVGTLAVQLARYAGAHVIGTASIANQAFVRSLGAHEVIDYMAMPFENVVHDVDVVLDTVGDDTLDRSFGVLKRGGVLVSIVSTPSPEKAEAYDVRSVFFIVRPNHAHLVQISGLVDAGLLHPVVKGVLSLAQVRTAYESVHSRGAQGKLVIRVFG